MINFEFIIGLALILYVVGILLSILSSFTESKSGNSSEKRIEKLLPGINCGQCGYPGCQAYAKALADSKAQANLCKPAGADVAKQIASMLGINSGDVRDYMSSFSHRDRLPIFMNHSAQVVVNVRENALLMLSLVY